jgi:hypothetical protein
MRLDNALHAARSGLRGCRNPVQIELFVKGEEDILVSRAFLAIQLQMMTTNSARAELHRFMSSFDDMEVCLSQQQQRQTFMLHGAKCATWAHSTRRQPQCRHQLGRIESRTFLASGALNLSSQLDHCYLVQYRGEAEAQM